MSTEVIVALIGCVGGIIGAIPTYLLTRHKNNAEVRKIDTETRMLEMGGAPIGSEGRPVASAQERKIKMLFVAADPKFNGHSSLNLGGENRAIVHGIRASKYVGVIELEQMWATRWKDLRDQLRRDIPVILHFAGSASKGSLMFESESGGWDRVSAEQFQALLSPLHDRIRLVFVNACDTGDLCQTLASSIDFVIGVQGPVADESAIRFATAFYEAISDLKPVHEAFNSALADLAPSDSAAYQLFSTRKGSNAYLSLPPSEKKT